MTKHLSVLAAGLLVAAAALAPDSARALDVSGVHFDDHVTLDGAPLVLNGVGVRHVTVFGIEVYVAGLYVPSRTSDATEILRTDRPRQLVAVMRRDVSHDQIGPGFRSAIEQVAGSGAARLRSELDAFAAWMPSMRNGQRLTVSYTPAGALVISTTASEISFHGSADLARAFFEMWIGPRPVEDGLHDGLLGR